VRGPIERATFSRRQREAAACSSIQRWTGRRPRSVIYECEICGGFHSWNLDCSNDANRYASKDDCAHRNGVRISDIDTRSMYQRLPPIRSGDCRFDNNSSISTYANTASARMMRFLARSQFTSGTVGPVEPSRSAIDRIPAHIARP
jgi:hypothetical protein